MQKVWLEKARWYRHLVQGGFLITCIFLGIQFYLFVRHFETHGQTPAYLRPPGIEGFLPVGALASLKYWVLTGIVDPTHPAALVLLLTFLGISLVARRSFCSWICPVGTLSEILWRLGNKVFGRRFTIWRWLDIPLRFVKYALLLFFVKLILIDMPAFAMQGFLASPYWAISDVKMLHFFTGISPTAAAVIGVLAALSTIYPNFWCRYLCPYGAMVGLAALPGPLKIRRNPDRCSGCGTCGRRCPSRLPVQARKAISSPECTGCLTCVDSCPERGALHLGLPWSKRRVGRRTFALLVVGLFALGVGAGMMSGHWQTKLTYQDYQRLIPMAARVR